MYTPIVSRWQHYGRFERKTTQQKFFRLVPGEPD